MTDLDTQLLAAHAANDHNLLVELYRQAAEQTTDQGAAAFYLTHAHIFALEMGHPDASDLRARLVEQGREAPMGPPRAPLR